MANQFSSLPIAVLLGDAAPIAQHDSDAATDVVHSQVRALQALLERPSNATIGELATLIQSITRDLSFLSAAMRDVIETTHPLADGGASSGGDQPLRREEIESLGDLLSAHARSGKVGKA